ncbi:MAG: hypothetical protein FJW35_03475 [Acidobacteria bacterium]|nr:hypothetical protein [Acidobacteriota bacterium]
MARSSLWNVGKCILALWAVCCAGLPACRQASESRSPQALDAAFTVTDALGRQVVFQEPPRRIALSGKALFMVTNALYMFPGGGRRIIATATTGQASSNFISLIDPEIAGKSILPETVGPEQIAGVQPDAVILKSHLARTVGRSLEVLDIPVIYVDFETPDQYLRDLRTLGELLRQPERTAELTRYFQGAVRRVEDAVADIPEAGRRRVLLLYYSTSRGPATLNVPPTSWMQTVMTEMAGGIAVWKKANPAKGWTQVSLEQIYAWDPDVIFVTSYNETSDAAAGRLRTDSNWQSVRALQNGRLHAFAGDFFSWDTPDPRWVLGLTWMARKLYPDRFRQVDILGLTREFYQVVYGQDAAFFDEQVRPVLRGDLP